mgnify:CR=1 FL=1
MFFELYPTHRSKQGPPVYGMSAKIVDDDGGRLPEDGEAFGRLLIQAPWVLDRYYKSEDSALEPDGFFDTGDLASIDSDGVIWIRDRAKDIVKSGGEWLSSVVGRQVLYSVFSFSKWLNALI